MARRKSLSVVLDVRKAHGVWTGLDIDPSGHSARVGVCQDMVASGFSLPEIMQAGGWKSPDMVARYSEHLQARQGAAAKLAAIQNR